MLNGIPLALSIHSNFGGYLQINHKDAGRVGITEKRHAGQFGITASGVLSSLGRDEGRLKNLRLGSALLTDVPASIFEVPAGGTRGMLGVKWLADNRVVLDFRTSRVRLGPTDPQRSALVKQLDEEHYQAIPLTRSFEDGRYLVPVTIGATTRRTVLSTVADTQVDTRFAKDAGVALKATASAQYGGPTGSVGEEVETKEPIKMRIGTWTAQPMSVTVLDTYAYMNGTVPQNPSEQRGGQIGFDLLSKSDAVIDFGEKILYLPLHASSK